MSDFTVFVFVFQMSPILNVKLENGLDIFRPFSTFSTFNLKYFEFKFWFKPNLVDCVVTQSNYRLLTMHLRSFYWWLAAFLLAISCLFWTYFYVWAIVLNT